MQGDWVFTETDMDRLERNMKIKANKKFSSLVDSRSPAYHIYLAQLNNFIDNYFDEFAEDVEVKREKLMLDHQKMSGQLKKKFEEKYPANLARLISGGTSKVELMEKYADKLVKNFKSNTEHKMNPVIEQKMKSQLMDDLQEVSIMIETDLSEDKRKADETIDLIINKAINDYEQVRLMIH